MTRMTACGAVIGWDDVRGGAGAGRIGSGAKTGAVGASIGGGKGVSVGKTKGVSVGKTKGVSVGKTKGVSVGKTMGVSVGSATGVAVGGTLGVSLGVTIGVAVSVGNGVGLGVGVGSGELGSGVFVGGDWKSRSARATWPRGANVKPAAMASNSSATSSIGSAFSWRRGDLRDGSRKGSVTLAG